MTPRRVRPIDIPEEAVEQVAELMNVDTAEAVDLLIRWLEHEEERNAEGEG
jgi:hypothetical protein